MRLTEEGCRDRQRRLVKSLDEKGLAGAILSRREHVYYFTGFLHNRFNAAAVFIAADGRTTLVAAGETDSIAFDELIPCEADYHATMHSRHYEDVAERLARCLPSSGRLGADLGGGIACIANLAECADITRDVYRLRKRKSPDEVLAIRSAIAVTEAMYVAAKETVKSGVDEVEVLAQLRAAATLEADEDLEHLGNDFQANSPGGSARRRKMQAGELYVLDAGTVRDGYFADNCRTFAVDGSPSDEQLKVWEHIDTLFPTLEATIKPGLKGVELYDLANRHLSENGYPGLVHHLGHGIGLAPHETPELNPNYDAVFEVGDVFTLEPGLYTDSLKAGMRLEEDYYLTESGLEKLTSFPRDLA